jgi:protein-tyrosine-phosphatase
MGSVVLFVCPHGSNKSRLAAAFFNRKYSAIP